MTKKERIKINKKHIKNGVIIIDPENTYIDESVEIGKNTVIYPNTYITGKVVIGERCQIRASYISDSIIGNDNTIGPYAHIRNNSIIGSNNRIGNFVEIKNTKIKDHTSAAHHAYLGDAEIGSNVTIGCGTITVNFDGKEKHKTIIEDECFIGCNVNLIAPITIKKGSLVAAGSTITVDVPEESLAIARERETIKEGYMKNKK